MSKDFDGFFSRNPSEKQGSNSEEFGRVKLALTNAKSYIKALEAEKQERDKKLELLLQRNNNLLARIELLKKFCQHEQKATDKSGRSYCVACHRVLSYP